MSGFESAVGVLCRKIREPLLAMPHELKRSVNEVRLRTGMPLCITLNGQSLFVTSDGQALRRVDGQTVICDRFDLLESFKAACEYSVYSYQNQINSGFVTISGGHRIGICGAAVVEDGRIINVKDISSMNLRIASERKHCADAVMPYIDGGAPHSTVLIGPPSCGKTTMLRDIAYQLALRRRVCVVDERTEICPSVSGQPVFDMGYMCDVMSGYPKAVGIVSAVRTLSPEVIIFDEIGGYDELFACADGFNSGAALVTSVHAGSIDEFLSRRIGAALVNGGVFEYFALMSGQVGRISRVYKRGELGVKAGGNNNVGRMPGGGRVDDVAEGGGKTAAVKADSAYDLPHKRIYNLPLGDA